MTTAHKPSRGCYERGCRRPECCRANYRYSKQLKLDHARGQRRTCDATQTRVHIERLLAAGWTQAQIARAARVHQSTIGDIHHGRETISIKTALAVMQIHIRPPVEASPVHAAGSMRRLQALMYIGHSLPAIASETGFSHDKLWQIAAGQFDHVDPDTAQVIARAYRKLAASPGNSPKARIHARKNGWHGPMVWDDIDDPNAQPEIDEHADKRGRRARVDDASVARLTRQGMSAEQIAFELGCHERTVIRARGRARDMAVAA